MRRLIFILVAIFVLGVLFSVGCSNKSMIGPSPGAGEEIASSCVSCHTDKSQLKEVAIPEPVEESSAETSGEG